MHNLLEMVSFSLVYWKIIQIMKYVNTRFLYCQFLKIWHVIVRRSFRK